MQSRLFSNPLTAAFPKSKLLLRKNHANNLLIVDCNNSSIYLDKHWYDKTKTKIWFYQVSCYLLPYIFFLRVFTTTTTRTSNLTIQTVQSTNCVFSYLGETRLGLLFWKSLYIAQRQQHSSRWKRATMIPLKFLTRFTLLSLLSVSSHRRAWHFKDSSGQRFIYTIDLTIIYSIKALQDRS